MCTLYERIQSLCKMSGVSGGRMCLDLGLSKSTLSDLKYGRTKGISIPTAQKIADYFGVSVDSLLTGEVPNGMSFSQEENPYELELRDTFDTLSVDDQIYVNEMVKRFAQNPAKYKEAPGELILTEGEKAMLKIFRLIPQDQQRVFLEMGRVYADNLKKD